VLALVRKRYLVKFAFNGNLFDGYARQRTGHTVEDEILGAMQAAELATDARTSRFQSAARVDKGVSAVSAAVAFSTEAPKERILRSLNGRSRNLAFHSIAEVPRDFNPRHLADTRWYRYHFRSVGLEQGLDLQRMRESAGLFLGEHDFSAFAKVEDRNPMRTIEDIGIERKGGFVILDIRGRSFLWNQVRRMATALWEVGAREADSTDIQAALEGRSPKTFGPAPAEGLFLFDVLYKGIEFDRPSEFQPGLLDRLRDEFYEQRCEAAFLEYLRELVPF
jgi:tRNA pseudouridine38-40 synthase